MTAVIRKRKEKYKTQGALYILLVGIEKYENNPVESHLLLHSVVLRTFSVPFLAGSRIQGTTASKILKQQPRRFKKFLIQAQVKCNKLKQKIEKKPIFYYLY